MLTLQHLNLCNFLSHQNTKLTFSPDEKILIDGPSGAGKSAIIEAIIWCLYGKGRSDNRSLIQVGKKNASVSIILRLQSTKGGEVGYRVRREISRTGKHVLSVSFQKDSGNFIPIKVSGKKNIQEYLEKQILHSSYLLFINSIVYPQDNLENFVKQPAKKRKEILLEIANASTYDEYYNRTKEKLSEFKQLYEKNQAVLDTINLTIQEDKKLAQGLKQLQNDTTTIATKIQDTKKKLENIREQIKKNEIIEIQIREKMEQMQNVAGQQGEIEEKLDEIESQLLEIKKLDYKDIEEKQKQLKALKKKQQEANEWDRKMLELTNKKPIFRDFDNEIDEINQQFIRLLNKEIEICPVVHEQCPLLTKERDKESGRLQIILKEKEKEQEDYVGKETVYITQTRDLGERPETDYNLLTTLENEIQQKLLTKETYQDKEKALKNNQDHFKYYWNSYADNLS